MQLPSVLPGLVRQHHEPGGGCQRGCRTCRGSRCWKARQLQDTTTQLTSARKCFQGWSGSTMSRLPSLSWPQQSTYETSFGSRAIIWGKDIGLKGFSGLFRQHHAQEAVLVPAPAST